MLLRLSYNCHGPIGRFLLPIGGGSAEVARKFYFLIKTGLSGTAAGMKKVKTPLGL